MSDAPEDRIYSVVEFLANQEQLTGKTVRIHGPVLSQSEAICRIGSWQLGTNFDAGDLPEQDRIKLVEIGPEGSGKPATLKLNCATGRAIHIEFDPA